MKPSPVRATLKEPPIEQPLVALAADDGAEAEIAIARLLLPGVRRGASGLGSKEGWDTRGIQSNDTASRCPESPRPPGSNVQSAGPPGELRA